MSIAVSEVEVSAILNAEVARYARKGWTVASVSGNQAVLQRNKRMGWFWNLVLTLLTAGLWLIVVFVQLVNRKKRSLIISVDAFGKVSTR